MQEYAFSVINLPGDCPQCITAGKYFLQKMRQYQNIIFD